MALQKYIYVVYYSFKIRCVHSMRNLLDSSVRREYAVFCLEVACGWDSGDGDYVTAYAVLSRLDPGLTRDGSFTRPYMHRPLHPA